MTGFSDLAALFVNCTLKRSPEPSHTQALADRSIALMRAQGVTVDVVRAVDHEIAAGVQPDMTEHGWAADEWPALYERVLAADILVLTTPIWLGEKSSVCTRVIERLYGNSHLLNDAGQYAYYGRAGGCIVTGNEDGAKHCAMNVLYSLQHLGLRDPAPGGRGVAGWRRPRAELPRRGLRRARERLHEPQHGLHDLEPDASRAHAARRRRLSGARQLPHGVGRGHGPGARQPRASGVALSVLPDPPAQLPPEPRAFYEALRATGVAGATEVDFGDAGIGLTFPGAVGAQVSRRAAIVFAGNAVEHFDERTPDWTAAAAASLARAVGG